MALNTCDCDIHPKFFLLLLLSIVLYVNVNCVKVKVGLPGYELVFVQTVSTMSTKKNKNGNTRMCHKLLLSIILKYFLKKYKKYFIQKLFYFFAYC